MRPETNQEIQSPNDLEAFIKEASEVKQLTQHAGWGILERDLKRKAEEYDAELLKAQSSVIISEVNSESKAARSWRPHLMYLFMIIIFNNYIVYPYLKAFTSYGMLMEIPPQMWTLLQIGVGGYVAGRSLEKALPGIMNNKK